MNNSHLNITEPQLIRFGSLSICHEKLQVKRCNVKTSRDGLRDWMRCFCKQNAFKGYLVAFRRWEPFHFGYLSPFSRAISLNLYYNLLQAVLAISFY